MKYSYEFDIHSDMAPSIIARRINNNSRILEFGTADGVLTKYLCEQKGCEVYGVEIEQEFAKAANKYVIDMHIGDIESYDWTRQYNNIKFDYIIFSDVLEHLKNPEKVLSESKKFLSKSGTVLLSIPNIAHSSIILGLFDNDFRYTETGLLDRTHLRFFTKKTIDNLIENAGFSTLFDTGVFLPPHRTEQNRSYKEVPFEVSQFIKNKPYSEVYQFIYEIGLGSYNAEKSYENSYLTKINIGSELDDTPITIYSENVPESDIYGFNLTLEDEVKIKFIHILVDNITFPFDFHSIKINGKNYDGFTTGFDKCDESTYSELYLPLIDSVQCKDIYFAIAPVDITNRKESEGILKKVINSMVNIFGR